MLIIQDSEYKVGLGIITTGKRTLPDYQLDSRFELKVYVDEDRKGPGYGRNFLSKYFYDSSFTHWVIMDDDVFITQPSHSQFLEEMVKVAAKGSWDMFISPEYFRDSIRNSHQQGEVLEWEGGGFIQWMMVTPKVIETIGYIPELKYGYGYEDGLYIEQMKMAQSLGLINNGVNGVLMPTKMLCYIHPSDMYGDNTSPYGNMTQEEKLFQSQGNWDEYIEKRNSILAGNYKFSFEG